MNQLALDQEAGPRRAARPLVRTTFAVLALALVVVGILLIRGWQPTSNEGASQLATMPISSAIEAKFGIRFTGVDVTAGGGMIQVRYQVLDSAKTEAIHGTELAPYVVDSHGTKFADPGMVGHSHVGKTQSPGTTDYILLANARGAVKPGSIVTIKVGDLELRNVPVQ